MSVVNPAVPQPLQYLFFVIRSLSMYLGERLTFAVAGDRKRSACERYTAVSQDHSASASGTCSASSLRGTALIEHPFRQRVFCVDVKEERASRPQVLGHMAERLCQPLVVKDVVQTVEQTNHCIELLRAEGLDRRHPADRTEYPDAQILPARVPCAAWRTPDRPRQRRSRAESEDGTRYQSHTQGPERD